MIVPRVIESTFVGPEDPIVGQETDGLLSQENGTVEGELDPDVAYCFSSCGDYPHVLSLLHESMWWSFPGDSDGNKEQNEDAEADGLGQLSDIKGTSGAYIVYASLGKLLKREYKLQIVKGKGAPTLNDWIKGLEIRQKQKSLMDEIDQITLARCKTCIRILFISSGTRSCTSTISFRYYVSNWSRCRTRC